ncbi:MAG: carboxypeptidase regulatory-like domain-containing protein, partial [Planctomycetes bacterium]|nr:carboxypeptidase regulatory-like domain-containing protein [Planctomycetota bacterium]
MKTKNINRLIRHQPMKTHPLLASLFLWIALLFALACGSGGSGAASPPGTHAFRFKVGDLLSQPPSSTLAIVELGGAEVALPQTPLSEDGLQILSAEFAPGKSWLLLVEVRGLPFLRTVISADQVDAAVLSGVLDFGEMNATTTYLAGLLETQLSGARRAAKDAIVALLADNFSSTAPNFAALTHAALMSGAVAPTANFRARMNRINLLRLYMYSLRNLAAAPDATQVSALKNLHDAFFDETSATNLLAKLSSPALPTLPGLADGGVAVLAELASRGIFFTGTGVLDSEELRRVYFDPVNHADLLLKALESPTSALSGSVSGMTLPGVTLTLSSASGISQSATSDADGSFSLAGLPAGNYTLVPSLAGHVFDPASLSLTLTSSDQALAGLAFSSLVNRGSVSVTPSANAQTFAEGYYSALTVTGNAALIAANIKEGVRIFGVLGSLIVEQFMDATATASQILSGRVGYGAAGRMVGTMTDYGALTLLPITSDQISVEGYYSAISVPGNVSLSANNLVYGVTVYGVTGANTLLVNTAAASASTSDILFGKTAYAQGAQLVGSVTTQTLSADSTAVAAGYYAATNLTSVDADLVTANIKSGVSIFGVSGSPMVVDTAGATASAGELISGKTIYINGSLVTGTLSNQTLSAESSTLAAGNYAAADLSVIEADLTPAKLASGANIFGVLGTDSGVDTASGNVTAGQLIAGAKAWAGGAEVTGSLANQALSAESTLMAAGNYSATTLSSIESELAQGNILSGANIFGVPGNAFVVNTGAGTASASDILSGKLAFVQGAPVTGSLATQSLSAHSETLAAGYYAASDLVTV